MIFFIFLSLIRTFADHTTLFLYEKKISFENSHADAAGYGAADSM